MEDQYIINYLAGDIASKNEIDGLEFSYISNPNGTIRWLFPKSLKSPWFLNFYSVSSLRAKFFCYIIKFAYFLGLSDLVKSGGLRIHVEPGSILNKILEKYKHDGFSIFLGTIGDNRKAILELHKDKQTFVYIKIALTDSSKELVNNEIKKIQLLNSFEFDKMILPKLLGSSTDTFVELSNIKPKIYQENIELNKLHIEVANELYRKTHKSLNLSALFALESAMQNTLFVLNNSQIQNGLDSVQIQEVCHKIIFLIEELNKKNEFVSVSIAHGDFTPWNMYVTKNKIHLFDWELSEYDMPLMYDLFHYVFQSTIMIKKGNYNEIYKSLSEILKSNKIQEMLNNYNINFNINYTFYLVYTISYYLKKYTKQEDLHEQVYWLINTWDDAISDLVKNKGVIF